MEVFSEYICESLVSFNVNRFYTYDRETYMFVQSNSHVKTETFMSSDNYGHQGWGN